MKDEFLSCLFLSSLIENVDANQIYELLFEFPAFSGIVSPASTASKGGKKLEWMQEFSTAT